MFRTIFYLLVTVILISFLRAVMGLIFKGFRDGVVYLKMKGACSGCPSSTATLRHGIENLLKHFLPDVQTVEQFEG